MSVDTVAIISLLWGFFINTLAFLAAHTSLGAYIHHLSSRLMEKLRESGFKWPETPVTPDRQEFFDALKQIRDLQLQNLNEQKVTSDLLRELRDQGTNHHPEIRDVLSESLCRLTTISDGSHAIREALDNHRLRKDVQVALASEVDRILRNLPQSIREAETRPTYRHRRVASA
ncbi:hypothetical protein BKA67DRAFT_660935 [Truncatella angustata]|uniref:Uncharacterized protein n=1 Tax=Truncatella angustata TaxID=152316 RepID=A0A9P8ZWJ7_9PEZI|nr:uncharacterized protein BKA67DRAFT_660935 [Truncatella angustata]KAH6652172.1 hypothetical protein BKA67DRAFT_660935 [Truncatella angustata]KAH8205076.1 hypothetical protein TruAng_000799 [Truncatella angustata]